MALTKRSRRSRRRTRSRRSRRRTRSRRRRRRSRRSRSRRRRSSRRTKRRMNLNPGEERKITANDVGKTVKCNVRAAERKSTVKRKTTVPFQGDFLPPGTVATKWGSGYVDPAIHTLIDSYRDNEHNRGLQMDRKIQNMF